MKTNESFSIDECPVDIKENMEKELRENPDTKKTLKDIHFEKYKGILDCYSLEDLKKKYPEFEDVNSVWDVEAHDKSFISEFQNGNSDVFPVNEDLTLQLIKLYWAKGLSLADLSKYIGENSSTRDKMNLWSVFQKLNIKTMPSRYAQVLKLSNKKYNEELFEAIQITKKERREEREQLAEGEPVVIPRGPLSEAHRKHISEGLKRYYRNNPDAIYNLSKRQKEFYENNPEERENLSIAADYAWNKTKEGKSVKKYLTKFMKKFNANISDDELCLKKDITKTNNNALKEFWKRNAWAKPMFSTAMEKGWDKVKEMKSQPVTIEENKSESVVYYFNTMPEIVKNKFIQWAQSTGQNTDDWHHIGTMSVFYKTDNIGTTKEEQQYAEKINMLSDKFFYKNQKISDDVASSRMLVLLSILRDLEKCHYRLPKSLRRDSEGIKDLLLCYQEINSQCLFYLADVEGNITGIPGISSDTITEIEKILIPIFCEYDASGFESLYNQRLEDAYSKLSNGRMQEAVSEYLC